jgi:hypothetical protein
MRAAICRRHSIASQPSQAASLCIGPGSTQLFLFSRPLAPILIAAPFSPRLSRYSLITPKPPLGQFPQHFKVTSAILDHGINGRRRRAVSSLQDLSCSGHLNCGARVIKQLGQNLTRTRLHAPPRESHQRPRPIFAFPTSGSGLSSELHRHGYWFPKAACRADWTVDGKDAKPPGPKAACTASATFCGTPKAAAIAAFVGLPILSIAWLTDARPPGVMPGRAGAVPRVAVPK